jgi:hopanoid biosynthesis associated protein HpnK
VAQAHRAGTLTSASLMVGGAAFDEAVALARTLPDLAVGLHLVLVDGWAVRGSQRHLTDAGGRFRASPLAAGLVYAFSPAARRALAAEIDAQFQRFAQTGLPLSHVDGHCHMHLHPAVFPQVLRLARHYGARGIRLPHDDLRLALRLDPRHALRKVSWTVVFGLLTRRAKRRIRQSRPADATGPDLLWPERTYGFMQTGQISAPYLEGLIAAGPAATAEVYCHPTTGPRLAELGPNSGELAALLSPVVKAAVVGRGIVPARYAELREAAPRTARQAAVRACAEAAGAAVGGRT